MKINERTLIEGLSYALDVAENSYFSHSKHVAYTSCMIAKELSLSVKEQEGIYYAAMLHDIGAGTVYGLKEHCSNGRDILLRLPLKKELAESVLYHHELYNGMGPFGLKGNEIPISAQIICLANTFDLQFGEKNLIGYEEFYQIKSWLDLNRAIFHPDIIRAFYHLLDKEFYLLDYFNDKFVHILNSRIDIPHRYLDYEAVSQYALAFAEIIDSRSHFTYRHSLGIAGLAKKFSIYLGYDEDMQNKMYIAGLLHDIGKLVIPIEIIEKEGSLTLTERYEINKHTYYTRWILEHVEGFEEITEYAANHHEKLNGKGYPLHKGASQLGEQERVMAICDIFQALTEERPYRKNLSKESVWEIIDKMVEKKELDGQLVKIAKEIL